MPGPKESKAIAKPVMIPRNVIGGAQHSCLCRDIMWLGTATISSRILPFNNQRVTADVNLLGSSAE